MVMSVEDWEIGAELDPLVGWEDWDLLASSELIIPGEGILANFPVVGIAPIGWALVTITSLLNFLEVLLFRCSAPAAEPLPGALPPGGGAVCVGAGWGAVAGGGGDMAGVAEGDEFESTCSTSLAIHPSRSLSLAAHMTCRVTVPFLWFSRMRKACFESLSSAASFRRPCLPI